MDYICICPGIPPAPPPPCIAIKLLNSAFFIMNSPCPRIATTGCTITGVAQWSQNRHDVVQQKQPSDCRCEQPTSAAKQQHELVPQAMFTISEGFLHHCPKHACLVHQQWQQQMPHCMQKCLIKSSCLSQEKSTSPVLHLNLHREVHIRFRAFSSGGEITWGPPEHNRLRPLCGIQARRNRPHTRALCAVLGAIPRGKRAKH